MKVIRREYQVEEKRRKLYKPILAGLLVVALFAGSIYVVQHFTKENSQRSRRTRVEDYTDKEDTDEAKADKEDLEDNIVFDQPESAVFIEGKVVAEGFVSPEEPRLATEDGSVVMSFDSLCFDEPVAARILEMDIENPPKDTILRIYDFQLDLEKQDESSTLNQLDGIVTLEIPYDVNSIPEGKRASECVVGVYYHEDLHEWIEETTIIDEAREVAIIYTTHLSGHGTMLDLTKEQDILSDFIIRLNKGTPSEKALPLKAERLINRLSEEDMTTIMNTLKTFGADEPTQILSDAMLKFLGDGGSFVGIGNEFLQMNGYSKALYEKMSKRLTVFGGLLFVGQLASDIYYQKPSGQIYFNTAKGLLFWQGVYAGTTLGGPIGGAFATAVLAGLFILDFSGIASIDIPLYIEEIYHRSAMTAYRAYYADNGRTDSDWINLSYKLIQEVTEEGLSGDAYNKRYIQLLEENVTDYCELFFKDEDELTKYMEAAYEFEQGYLGNYDRVYSDSDSKQNKEYVDEYVEEILDGTYKGTTTSLRDELQEKYKKEIIEVKIPEIMKNRSEYQYIKQLELLRVQQVELCQMLNTTFYIHFTDRSVEDDEDSEYEGYYMAPIVEEGLVDYLPETWIVTLNSEGEGTLPMNVLAHYRAKYFNQFGLYAKEDYDKLLEGTAEPVKIIEMGTISSTRHDINISGDDAEITIEGDRETLIEVTGGGAVEYSFTGGSDYDKDCYIVWDFGDGNETKKNGNKSTVKHVFEEAANYRITATLYDSEDTKLDSDSVSVMVVYAKDKSDYSGLVWELIDTEVVLGEYGYGGDTWVADSIVSNGTIRWTYTFIGEPDDQNFAGDYSAYTVSWPALKDSYELEEAISGVLSVTKEKVGHANVSPLGGIVIGEYYNNDVQIWDLDVFEASFEYSHTLGSVKSSAGDISTVIVYDNQYNMITYTYEAVDYGN